MESVQTDKSCTAVEFSAEEKQIAERHKVKPKLVRLLDQIIEGKLAGQSKPEPEEIETQQGHVDAPGESPKDKESEHLTKRVQFGLAEIQKIVGFYPVEYRPEILAVALEQASKVMGPIEKLVAMEPQVHKACDNIDSRTKAVIAVLGELSSVGDISNDVGHYGLDILHSKYGKKHLEQACEQYPDDQNLKFLSEVFKLARCINKAEDKSYVSRTVKPTEEEIPDTEEPQPQPTEPEDTDTEDTEAGPDTGIKALDDFLETLSYEAKATAYGALRLVCVSDATGKKMRDYLRRQVALLDDPKQEAMMDIQVLADIKWFLGFVRGAEIGLKEC